MNKPHIDEIVKKFRDKIIELDDKNTEISSSTPFKRDIYFDGVEMETWLKQALTTQQNNYRKEVVAVLEGMERKDRTLDGFTGEVSITRIEGYNQALQEAKDKISNIKQ